MTQPIVRRFVRYRLSGSEGRAELHPDGRLTVDQGPAARTLDEVELLPPVAPSKIIGIGRNYRAHAEELGNAVPAEPLMFLMPSTAVIASGEAIVRPSGYERVDHEGELAVVFGRRARNVPADRAMEVVAGFSCFNDVSVRDLQRRDGQFTRAKGFDTFAPLGPCLAVGLDWAHTTVVTRVNGEERQRGSTEQMIFDIPTLVEAVTRVMTMLPGDVIATGTPEGVGQIWPGDTVEVEIEGIGVLSNPVIAEDSP